MTGKALSHVTAGLRPAALHRAAPDYFAGSFGGGRYEFILPNFLWLRDAKVCLFYVNVLDYQVMFYVLQDIIGFQAHASEQRCLRLFSHSSRRPCHSSELCTSISQPVYG